MVITSANDVRSAAVIGAGIMGSGIAALLADAGIDVFLLDLDAAAAKAAVDRLVARNGFSDPASVGRITTGSSGTDLALVGAVDWIIEAAAERLEVKRDLFRAVDEIRRPGSIVSSSTSTIRLTALVAGMSDTFAQDFLITHFFNPPQQMRLLEIVAGPQTAPGVVERIRAIAENDLGKVVVDAKDTPAFIANRIGNYWMACALQEAVARHLKVEDADAVIGRPFGMPAGVFAFLDVVGIDLIPVAWSSLAAALPADDDLQRYLAPLDIVGILITRKLIGRKAGAGFWRRTPDGMDVFDLETRSYRPAGKPQTTALGDDPTNLRAMLEHDDASSRYARAVICDTLAYAASLVPEVVETPELADLAMRHGYGWKWGPFELIQHVGGDWLADILTEAGRMVPAYLQTSLAA